MVPKSVLPIVDEISSHLDNYIPAEYVKEMQCFSKVFNMNIGEVFMMNLIYDLSELDTFDISTKYYINDIEHIFSIALSYKVYYIN